MASLYPPLAHGWSVRDKRLRYHSLFSSVARSHVVSLPLGERLYESRVPSVFSRNFRFRRYVYDVPLPSPPMLHLLTDSQYISDSRDHLGGNASYPDLWSRVRNNEQRRSASGRQPLSTGCLTAVVKHLVRIRPVFSLGICRSQ